MKRGKEGIKSRIYMSFVHCAFLEDRVLCIAERSERDNEITFAVSLGCQAVLGLVTIIKIDKSDFSWTG